MSPGSFTRMSHVLKKIARNQDNDCNKLMNMAMKLIHRKDNGDSNGN